MQLPDSKSRQAALVGMLTIAVLTLSYLGWHANQGWIAHDEGLLGHTAERTLQGETPHVEFQDVYTGLLSHLHATSFRVLGIQLTSMRIPLLIGATMTAMVWYLIALRFAHPVIAAMVTLASMVWSFPNYFAALPSWYILMTSSWAIWALFKFHETKLRRFIAVAAICSGTAILFKIVGLYLVAASLFAIWISRCELATDPVESRSKPARNLHLKTGLFLALVFTLMVCLLIREHLGFSTLIYFVLPVTAAMAAMLGFSQQSSTPLRLTITDCLIFCVVLSIPLAAFTLPYALSGHLESLLTGLFELPQARLERAASLPPHAAWCLVAVPFVSLTLVEKKLPQSMILPLTATMVLGSASLILLASTDMIYQALFFAVQCSLPAIGLAVYYCGRSGESNVPLVILVITATCMGLTQYPYSSGIYFSYCAPLIGLSLLGLVTRTGSFEKPLWITLTVFLTIFAVVHVNYSNPRRVGIARQYLDNAFPLQSSRSGLLVSYAEQLEYNRILQLIDEHSRPDDYILAGPDCPQFYFLSGRRNPTTQCYDLFRAYQLGGQSQLEEHLKQQILDKAIPLFIHNQLPEFSHGYSQEFLQWLEQWGKKLPPTGSGRFQIFHKKML